MSTTTVKMPADPAPVSREPDTLEQIAGLTETVRRVVVERDAARLRVAQLTEDLTAAQHRAERAESYGVALDNAVRSRDAEIRDLRARLAAAEQAARPPQDSEAEPTPTRLPEPPQRPVRRRSWRRPQRRH